jgi:hypothetical protein
LFPDTLATVADKLQQLKNDLEKDIVQQDRSLKKRARRYSRPGE